MGQVHALNNLFDTLDIPLERDGFSRTIIRELSG